MGQYSSSYYCPWENGQERSVPYRCLTSEKGQVKNKITLKNATMKPNTWFANKIRNRNHLRDRRLGVTTSKVPRSQFSLRGLETQPYHSQPYSRHPSKKQNPPGLAKERHSCLPFKWELTEALKDQAGTQNHTETILFKTLLGPLALTSYWLTLTS